MIAKALYTSNKTHVEIGIQSQYCNGSRWSRLYRHEFPGALSIRRGNATFNVVSNLGPTMNKSDLSPEQSALRIQELEARLKQEPIRSAGLETMIDLTESDLKILI